MKSGDVLASKYRLVQRIGEGAMGEVWAGENLSTGRKVALKLIIRSASKQSTQELRQRMVREARACGKLAHRNIVQIFDVGTTPEGDPFLVLELLRGRTLGERLKDTRRIEPMTAARIGADIASALAVAHAAKIIHRDLKPANIFLHHEDGDPDERFVVKVLDFGVSKNIDGNTDGPATITNVAVGSPVYMSPEQVALYKDLDGRTDIWSLGVVLYEMLTGGRPFGGSMEDVVRQIILTRINKVPAPSTKLRDVSPEFDAIVLRCLENDRAHRYGDAGEVARVLAAIAESGASTRMGGSFTRSFVLDAQRAGTETVLPAMATMGPSASVIPRQTTHSAVPIGEGLGPTGTLLMAAKHLTSSPAPTWRKEMAEWRAQREATATRMGALDAPQGGTQAIDAAAVLLAAAGAQTGTTSALGALSTAPNVPTPDFEPNGATATASRLSRRKQSSRILIGLMGAGVLSACVLLLGLAHVASSENEPKPAAPATSGDTTSAASSATTSSSPIRPVTSNEKYVEPIASAIPSFNIWGFGPPSASFAPNPSATLLNQPAAPNPVRLRQADPAPATSKPVLLTCTRSGETRTCTRPKKKSRLVDNPFSPNAL